MDGNKPSVDRILEEAANIVGRREEATGDVEPSEGYKRKQIEELKEFVTKQNLWYSIDLLTFLSKGGENEVFYDGRGSVIKLNNFEYAGDDLLNFFIRIQAHNMFFRNAPYTMIGFAYNSQQEFCAVLEQPYIRAKREAREEEIQYYMESIGFIMDYPDEYHNERYEIFDAVPNNVLYGIDDNLYFIDTQIKLRGSFVFEG